MSKKYGPIYSKSSSFRIAYVANERWQLQYRRTEAKGTNRGKKDPHFDPWEPYQRPTDFCKSAGVIASHCPASKGGGAK